MYGEVTAPNKKISVKEMKLTGDRLYFVIEQEMGKKIIPIRFEGKANTNFIVGTIKSNIITGTDSAVWEAVRNPLTIDPLEKW